nr:hypothetical protein [Anaerolineae bacterium]
MNNEQKRIAGGEPTIKFDESQRGKDVGDRLGQDGVAQAGGRGADEGGEQSQSQPQEQEEVARLPPAVQAQRDAGPQKRPAEEVEYRAVGDIVQPFRVTGGVEHPQRRPDGLQQWAGIAGSQFPQRHGQFGQAGVGPDALCGGLAAPPRDGDPQRQRQRGHNRQRQEEAAPVTGLKSLS